MSQPRHPRSLLRRLRRPVKSARAGLAQPMVPPPHEPVPDWLRQDALDNANMRRLASFLLGPDDTAIDIGANHGGMLAEIVRVAPRGRHMAFEPIPNLAQQLRERFPQVQIHEAAASNRSGRSQF